tara:strand:+ start:4515 stop:4718 length:204 start_codon:yes stop_codon:yes gene_type:complete
MIDKLKKLLLENCVVRFLRYAATWHQHRETIKYLYSLSDRELRDVGINRNEIVDLIFRKDDLENYKR